MSRIGGCGKLLQLCKHLFSTMIHLVWLWQVYVLMFTRRTPIPSETEFLGYGPVGVRAGYLSGQREDQLYKITPLSTLL